MSGGSNERRLSLARGPWSVPRTVASRWCRPDVCQENRQDSRQDGSHDWHVKGTASTTWTPSWVASGLGWLQSPGSGAPGYNGALGNDLPRAVPGFAGEAVFLREKWIGRIRRTSSAHRVSECLQHNRGLDACGCCPCPALPRITKSSLISWY
jgi:hypothetical protein